LILSSLSDCHRTRQLFQRGGRELAPDEGLAFEPDAINHLISCWGNNGGHLDLDDSHEGSTGFLPYNLAGFHIRDVTYISLVGKRFL
jgi:hypothetical protein